MNTQPALQYFSEQRDKRVHAALPIRVSYWQDGVRSGVHLACTYDISPSCARVIGLREECRVADLITVERGRNKALFRVCWVGEFDLRGQFGIECVEGEKVPWALDLQEADEIYDPILGRNLSLALERGNGNNRRRAPRFLVDEATGLLNPRRGIRVTAQVQDISEYGCQLTVPAVIAPGNDVELNLKVSNIPVTLRGKIRHAAQNLVSGVEFHGIRRGDRPILQSLLRKLQNEYREACGWNLEVTGVSS